MGIPFQRSISYHLTEKHSESVKNFNFLWFSLDYKRLIRMTE